NVAPALASSASAATPASDPAMLTEAGETRTTLEEFDRTLKAAQTPEHVTSKFIPTQFLQRGNAAYQEGDANEAILNYYRQWNVLNWPSSPGTASGYFADRDKIKGSVMRNLKLAFLDKMEREGSPADDNSSYLFHGYRDFDGVIRAHDASAGYRGGKGYYTTTYPAYALGYADIRPGVANPGSSQLIDPGAAIVAIRIDGIREEDFPKVDINEFKESYSPNPFSGRKPRWTGKTTIEEAMEEYVTEQIGNEPLYKLVYPGGDIFEGQGDEIVIRDPALLDPARMRVISPKDILTNEVLEALSLKFPEKNKSFALLTVNPSRFYRMPAAAVSASDAAMLGQTASETTAQETSALSQVRTALANAQLPMMPSSIDLTSYGAALNAQQREVISNVYAVVSGMEGMDDYPSEEALWQAIPVLINAGKTPGAFTDWQALRTHLMSQGVDAATADFVSDERVMQGLAGRLKSPETTSGTSSQYGNEIGRSTKTVTYENRFPGFNRHMLAQMREQGKTPEKPYVHVEIGIGKSGAPTVFDLVKDLQEAGYRNVVIYAVDNDQKNIDNANDRLNQESLPAGYSIQFVREGDFDLKKHGIESVDQIRVANVLQYYTPEQQQTAIGRMTEALQANGSLYVLEQGMAAMAQRTGGSQKWASRYDVFVDQYTKNGLRESGLYFQTDNDIVLQRQTTPPAVQKAVMSDPAMLVREETRSVAVSPSTAPGALLTAVDLGERISPEKMDKLFHLANAGAKDPESLNDFLKGVGVSEETAKEVIAALQAESGSRASGSSNAANDVGSLLLASATGPNIKEEKWKVFYEEKLKALLSGDEELIANLGAREYFWAFVMDFLNKGNLDWQEFEAELLKMKEENPQRYALWAPVLEEVAKARPQIAQLAADEMAQMSEQVREAVSQAPNTPEALAALEARLTDEQYVKAIVWQLILAQGPWQDFLVKLRAGKVGNAELWKPVLERLAQKQIEIWQQVLPKEAPLSLEAMQEAAAGSQVQGETPADQAQLSKADDNKEDQKAVVDEKAGVNAEAQPENVGVWVTPSESTPTNVTPPTIIITPTSISGLLILGKAAEEESLPLGQEEQSQHVTYALVVSGPALATPVETTDGGSGDGTGSGAAGAGRSAGRASNVPIVQYVNASSNRADIHVVVSNLSQIRSTTGRYFVAIESPQKVFGSGNVSPTIIRSVVRFLIGSDRKGSRGEKTWKVVVVSVKVPVVEVDVAVKNAVIDAVNEALAGVVLDGRDAVEVLVVDVDVAVNVETRSRSRRIRSLANQGAVRDHSMWVAMVLPGVKVGNAIATVVKD
ncbi:MAG TPA: hypothetical protein VLJ10_00950, partial [Candidatus Bathyarchaeia archaeon]|nr:hypothetical protein [Candidatus Bathyarchaeia archaeon]